MQLKSLIVGLLCFVFAICRAAVAQVDPALAEKLQKEGLVGAVHGADHQRGLYLFTYQYPDNFFKRVNFSLLTSDKEIKKILKDLERGDQIRVKGKLGGQETPQPHLYLSNIEVTQKYDPKVEYPAGEMARETRIPEDLIGKTELFGMVHAVEGQGHVLVLDYNNDTVLPMIAEKATDLTKSLYRGDVVRVQFELQENPGRPTHLRLNEKPTNGRAAVEVLEKFQSLNDKEITLDGRLTLMPPSNTNTQTTWAVEQVLDHGLFRYFMFIPAYDSEKDKIHQMLDAHWKANSSQSFKGRGKFINLKARVKVKGKAIAVMPNQSNPLFEVTADQIEVY